MYLIVLKDKMRRDMMIIKIKKNTEEEKINNMVDFIKKVEGVEIQFIRSKEGISFGITGDIKAINKNSLLNNEYVDEIIEVKEPYKKVNRAFKPEDTIVSIGGEKIGGKKFSVIAGPCSVESENQILAIASEVKKHGAQFLRGGAYKPRTSPYSFQGMKKDGLELLIKARKSTGLPIVTELMSPYDIEHFEENVDIIQVGARNMQNFELLKELGKTKKPILLKRGLSNTIEELLMSAEYIMYGGNENIILCERGIRTFERYTRNTLDISAIPIIKKLSHLPVVVDPSHSSGKWWLVDPLARAALVAGADGIIVEVHNDPENALCDGDQSIKPSKFADMMKGLKAIGDAIGKEV